MSKLSSTKENEFDVDGNHLNRALVRKVIKAKKLNRGQKKDATLLDAKQRIMASINSSQSWNPQKVKKAINKGHQDAIFRDTKDSDYRVAHNSIFGKPRARSSKHKRPTFNDDCSENATKNFEDYKATPNLKIKPPKSKISEWTTSGASRRYRTSAYGQTRRSTSAETNFSPSLFNKEIREIRRGNNHQEKHSNYWDSVNQQIKELLEEQKADTSDEFPSQKSSTFGVSAFSGHSRYEGRKNTARDYNNYSGREDTIYSSTTPDNLTEAVSTNRKATAEESPIVINVKKAEQVDFRLHLEMPEFEEVKARRDNFCKKMNDRGLRSYPYEMTNNSFKTNANTRIRRTETENSQNKVGLRRSALNKGRAHKKIPFKWVKFQHTTSEDVYRFRCFDQRDLGFKSKEFLAQIVDVENDDDYATDNEILHRSIQKVNNDLSSALKDHLDGYPTLSRETRKLVYGEAK